MNAPPPVLPMCLARVGALLSDNLRASHAALVAAVRPLVHDDDDARWYALLCVALLRWNDGHVHDGLSVALPAWEAADLRAHRGLQLVVSLVAARQRVTFATFDLDRLVFSAHCPRLAKVFEGDQLLARGEAVGGLMVAGEVAFLLRTKGRWRAVYGGVQSRPFDRVERGLLHGDTPVYVVRDKAKRRVIVGAADGPSWERVKLPGWDGTMMEVAPDFFVDFEEPGPVVYAAKGRRGWTVVRDGADAGRAWERLEDLRVRDGAPCYRGKVARRWVVVEGERSGPAYDDVPKVTWVGGRAVYRARTGKRWTVVDGDRYRHWYDEVSPGEMRDDDPFYAGRDAQGWWVHHGARRWGPYRDVRRLPQPLQEAPEEAAPTPERVVYQARLDDAAGEAVFVDGAPVASFETVVATHVTTAGVVCAGRRAGRVVVRDVDGAEVASVERLVSLGPAAHDALFERLDGRTYFVSQEKKRQRLHAGAWRSPPADRIDPLWLTCRGEPVYAARDGGRWWLCVGARKRPLKRRPTGAWGPDTDGAETHGSFHLDFGKTTVAVVL